jgi:peptidyl-prolyl cis-trans isomerase C
MKNAMPTVLGLLSALLLLLPLPGAHADSDSDVLATRGEGVLTHTQFDAHVTRIPAENRATVLRDRSKLGDILDQLLIANQLAVAAEAAGFDQDPVIKERMALSAREELAGAWLAHYVASQPDADYLTMAREYWKVNRDAFMTDAEIDVSHILVSNDERTDEEALQLADELFKRLQENPGEFDKLVLEFSNDPSAASNKGKFFAVKQGQMVKPFELAAFALEEGEISSPVQTVYGYHLIRLDANRPAQQRPFKDVRDRLVRQMRVKYREDLRKKYLSELYANEIVLDQQDLEAMVERQFDIDLDGDTTAGGQGE